MGQWNKDKAVYTCHFCRKQTVAELLNFGMQPVCSRFRASAADEEYTRPMLLGQCDACGLVQISTPVPASELTPPYDWIAYNEPESHLDQLAEIISHLPGVTKESAICGLSGMDRPLLKRMEERGFQHVWQVDLKEDLGVNIPRAGVETIQDRFEPETARTIARIHGRPDVIVAGYILEHAHDLPKFMGALKELVSPKGHIVIEVPDCKRMMEKYDYSALWEEHILYFTPETLCRSLTLSGLLPVYFESFPYELEDCLIAIAEPQEAPASSPEAESVLKIERRRAHAYADGFDKKREGLNKFLREYCQSRGGAAVFGAGHRACTFINLLGLKDHIEFIVDDDPKKQNLFMPGSQLPIHRSSALLEKDITLCLLSLSPGSEERVIRANQAFLERGGAFFSIFPDSKRALRI